MKPSRTATFAAFSIVVCLLATSLCIADLMHARTIAVGVARREAENLTYSLGRQSSATFDAADGALRVLAERVERDGTGSAVRPRLRETMMALIAATPLLQDVRIVDERGLPVVNGAVAAAPRASVANEPYFRFHRAHDKAQSVIGWSAGAAGATPRLWATRRLDHTDGTFAGVAIASISLPAFDQSFAGFDVGRSGVIALVGDDGVLLIRRPRAAGGQRFADVDRFQDAYKQFTGASFVRVSPVDGARRLVALQRLAGRPLFVEVGLAEDEYLAAWRADALANYVALGLGTALIAALASGLGTQITRRKRAEDALALLPVDVMTGLASRGRFDAELTREWRLAADDRLPLGLLMVNVGNLKAYNDRYGREEGDELLISVARTISNLASPSDLAARYSGLELAVILPATDDPAARATAERLRVAVTELIARLTRARGVAVNLTIGAASLVPSSLGEPSTLIGAAFMALRASQNEHPGNAAALFPDALTGLANRRHFDAELEREWERSVANAKPLGLLLVEVENLKPYNDRNGHEAGDEMLISIARSITRVVGQNQLAARYNGLDFAVLLPGTDQAGAQRLEERIRSAVREIIARQGGSETEGMKVCTAAVSSLPKASDKSSTLIGATFTALHSAKSS